MNKNNDIFPTYKATNSKITIKHGDSIPMLKVEIGGGMDYHMEGNKKMVDKINLTYISLTAETVKKLGILPKKIISYILGTVKHESFLNKNGNING